jgi:hypothetical protein
MYSVNYDGLKKRETYNEIVEYLQYGQEKIKYPDRSAKQLRESPQLSNLLDGDGAGLMDMEEEQDMGMKRQQMELKVRGLAKSQKATAQLLRSNVRKFTRPQTFDIATSDYDTAISSAASEAEAFLDEQRKDDDDKRGRGAGAVKMMLQEAAKPEMHQTSHVEALMNVAQEAIPILQFGGYAAGTILAAGLAIQAAPYVAGAGALYAGMKMLPGTGQSSVATPGYDPPTEEASSSTSTVRRYRINGKRPPTDDERANDIAQKRMMMAEAAARARRGGSSSSKDKDNKYPKKK